MRNSGHWQHVHATTTFACITVIALPCRLHKAFAWEVDAAWCLCAKAIVTSYGARDLFLPLSPN